MQSHGVQQQQQLVEANNNEDESLSSPTQRLVHFRSDHRDMSELEMRKKMEAQAKLQQDLLIQMEEKKKAKEVERKKMAADEQRELIRIQKEQDQLRRQFEGEKEKGNRKLHQRRQGTGMPFINLSDDQNQQSPSPTVVGIALDNHENSNTTTHKRRQVQLTLQNLRDS